MVPADLIDNRKWDEIAVLVKEAVAALK